MGAVITCIDGKKLNKKFAGLTYDRNFLQALPGDIDPCGERGEFHSFVYAAPFFASPLEIELGEVVERDGFIFADVLSP
jgi:diphthamide synthase (EF-2-diphthine--ammonia ligase)